VTALRIRSLQPDDVGACAELLDGLPQWFGIPDANAAYIASLTRLPGFVAAEGQELVGFVALERYGDAAAEVVVMAVAPDRHRRGAGRALIDASERWCADAGVTWLHVKTRGPSTYDDDYERTRRFYRAMGFTPLYESCTEWGPRNAALVLVKHLGCI
jgi:GNAT superfamily N-acetyltransferase